MVVIISTYEFKVVILSLVNDTLSFPIYVALYDCILSFLVSSKKNVTFFLFRNNLSLESFLDELIYSYTSIYDLF